MNAFRLLREQRLLAATKPFLARGITVKRCQNCWLGQAYCICHALKASVASCDIDIVLLMHRDEILKPTNTGRLIAEVLPNNCYAYQWHRKEPPADLLALLQDENRQCILFFPSVDASLSVSTTQLQLAGRQSTHKKITVIVPDGTWREASRMANLSGYLQILPRVNLVAAEPGQYSVRSATDKSRLATAEAVAQLLDECGEIAAAQALQTAFHIFNHHYRAMRDCVPVSGALCK